MSIPYQPDFYRTKAHYSNLYWGASIGAFTYLANRRGYKLICINDLGNNAFFVKKDASDISEVSIENAWHEAVYRESRDEVGNLTFMSLEEGRKAIGDMPVIEVDTGNEKHIRDLRL